MTRSKEHKTIWIGYVEVEHPVEDCGQPKVNTKGRVPVVETYMECPWKGES